MKLFSTFVLGAMLAAGSSEAAIAQDVAAGAPFSEMQGMWYDMTHKVAVEVRGTTVTVREIDTPDVTINRNGWTPGTVIATYTGAKQEGDETFRLSGSCWSYGSNKMSDICFDNLMKYNRPGTKPYSRLRAASLTLWRKEKFTPAQWNARD